MNFCNQSNGNGFKNLNSPVDSGKCGCGPEGSTGAALQYEPLTAEWFKENAGIIAIFVTVVLFLTKK